MPTTADVPASACSDPPAPIERRRLLLSGRVQGVGMRPFLCRLAGELGLAGWVGNAPEGVTVEVEGAGEALALFEQRLRREAPPQARVAECIAAPIPAIGTEQGFRVAASLTFGAPEPCAPPDLAPCPACLRELFGPAGRRYRYPFISCCDCGPRYSILKALPFDRERTSMAGFPLCPACREEYENPRDRRLPAQTTCCPECGPQLRWLAPDGEAHAAGEAALGQAVSTLRNGGIVALQGVGGFQLLVDAGNEVAVATLRERKCRPAKPFAVLADLAMARALCRVSAEEEALLQEPAAPIVVLEQSKNVGWGESATNPSGTDLHLPDKTAGLPFCTAKPPEGERTGVRSERCRAGLPGMSPNICGRTDSSGFLPSPQPTLLQPPPEEQQGWHIASSVAPGLPWLGVMLPASPLHHLLLADFGAPLVATSGNRSDEPICIGPREALERLAGIADGFLVHDRPILRPLDDSVLRIAAGRPLMLRRARGYTPEPIELAASIPPLLAAGGHLKNTVALGAGRRVLLSQHLGDLDDALTLRQRQATLDELPGLFGIQPEAVACDLHPDYASSRLAHNGSLPVVPIAHHYAHALACMAEHGLQAPLLALAWDGLGLGEDGTLWGGEFLVVEEHGYRRIASFLPLPLIGGEKAVREPRRAALAVLHGIYGNDCLEYLPAPLRGAFAPQEPALFLRMLERQLNTPPCSSVGRLFDAVSALLGLCFINRFEGQAAMLLEAVAQSREAKETPPYPFALLPGDPQRVDWRPLLAEILAEQSRGIPENRLAARFHATLAEIALRVASLGDHGTVVLCGGCLQNRLLLEGCAARLRQGGYGVHWPQRIPPNDGGLALGQLLGAARQLREN